MGSFAAERVKLVVGQAVDCFELGRVPGNEGGSLEKGSLVC